MVLDRYIAKTVIAGCLLASFVMLSIFVFVDFIGQLDDVGKGDYGVMQALVYVLLNLPQRLYELSPSILLLGGILSLGTLAANSELIVMRASGITTARITRSVLQTGLFIAILVAILGEFIAPSASREAKAYRTQAIEQKQVVGGSENIWLRDGNRYIHVKKILPNRQLLHIYIYETDDNQQLSAITYAEQAQYLNHEWVLSKVKRSELSASGVKTFHKDQLILKRLIKSDLFTVLDVDSSDMSARELLTYSQYLEDNYLDSDEYRLSFWIKIFTPLTGLVMLMIAMPIVFATTPRSGGVGQRIVLAIVIGIVYFVFNRFVNHLGLAMNVSPLLSASAPLIVVTMVSLYFLRRVH